MQLLITSSHIFRLLAPFAIVLFSLAGSALGDEDVIRKGSKPPQYVGFPSQTTCSFDVDPVSASGQVILTGFKSNKQCDRAGSCHATFGIPTDGDFPVNLTVKADFVLGGGLNGASRYIYDSPILAIRLDGFLTQRTCLDKPAASILGQLPTVSNVATEPLVVRSLNENQLLNFPASATCKFPGGDNYDVAGEVLKKGFSSNTCNVNNDCPQAFIQPRPGHYPVKFTYDASWTSNSDGTDVLYFFEGYLHAQKQNPDLTTVRCILK